MNTAEKTQKLSLKRRLQRFIYRSQRTEYFWELRQKALHHKNVWVRKWCNWRYLQLMSRNNADIPLIAQMDGMPVFPHGLSGIFVSNGARIGKNCVIFHQVTIGSNSLPDSPGHGAPVIGDDVYIGCGAKIIGNVRVGSNVRIGANCVVTRDVPDNATVVLEKPRVIVHAEPRDNRLVVFTGENR